jgi:putative membrane protein
MKLIIRLLINAVAVWVTAYIVPGVNFTGGILELLVVALIFGLVNALIRPIFKLLTLPINIATLGLFTLVINALMLWLTAWISGALTVEGGLVTGFLNALLGSLLISIVSMVLSWFLPGD